MPIRFRCCYCGRLLSIGRRKMGAVVECPVCHGRVGVPDDGAGGEEPPGQPPVPPEPVTVDRRAHGLVLSPFAAGVLLAGAVVVLGVAFLIGVLLGRFAL